jgi:hypothetical protein
MQFAPPAFTFFHDGDNGIIRCLPNGSRTKIWSPLFQTHYKKGTITKNIFVLRRGGY